MGIREDANIVFYNLILSHVFSNSNWNHFHIVFENKLMKSKYSLYIHNTNL